jgi:hypothetical protein
MLPLTQSWTPLSPYISCNRQWKDSFWWIEFRIHKLVEFLFMRESWEACKTCYFDSWGSCRTPNIGLSSSCLHFYRAWLRGLFRWYVEGWLSWSSSRGQPRGALPLHQVMQRQFIKFADPTRRSGHNNLLHVLHRCVHIIWYQSLRFLSRIVLVFGRIDFIYLLSTNSQKENLQPKFICATDFVVCFIEF